MGRRRGGLTSKTRVLFIGLDSAEPEQLRDWTESGDLPALRRLRDGGTWGAVSTPPGFGNGVLWPSLFTGVNAARHGRYFNRQIKPGSYDVIPFSDEHDFKREPFWCLLSQAGRRVAVIDMVRAPYTPGINGIDVADWLTHDAGGPLRTWPPELADELVERYGIDPFGGHSDGENRSAEDYVALFEQTLARIDTKTTMTVDYLRREDWDLFITAYADPHDIGHQCWHIHDTSDPYHDAALRRRLGDPVKKTIQAIDAGIARVLDAAAPDTTVIVFSGPGMGQGHTGNFLLDRILRRIECGHGGAGAPNVETVRSLYRRLLPKALRTRIRDLAVPSYKAMTAHDWRGRKSFAVPHNSNSGAVRINVVGREPEGKIHPGAEYDAYCEALIEDLMAIVNLETGEPLVEEVVKVHECYEGPHLNDLPDLLVIWHRPKPISAVGSPKIGEIHEEYSGKRTGDHTPRAIFYAHGPAIEPGELAAPVSAMDLAATMTALLGVALLGGDGAPIAQFGLTDISAETG